MSAQAIRLTEVDIDNALANDHLDVVFQPIFSLEDGTLTRMEAFIRWDHPGLGVLPPGAFISFFEAQGRMGELTRYVLRRAVGAYAAWRGTSGPGFSVNLAQSDLTDESFAADVGGILGAAGMPPHLVTLECPPLPPETEDGAGLAHLRRLAATGCPLAAEVRGRAPSYLAAADPFPFAEIKTGGSTILRFARTARGGPGLEAVSELVDLAGRHGARIVAVGVEEEEAALALRRLGFGAAQGNLLAAATPLDGFTAQTINAVRTVIGLEPMTQEALGAAVGRQAEAPLVLGTPEAAPPATEPAAPADATAIAIQRLKARKIAAKRAALRRAQEARAQAEAEVEAAREASDTARRLQERLAAELEGDADAPAGDPLANDAAPQASVERAEPAISDPDAVVIEPTAADPADDIDPDDQPPASDTSPVPGTGPDASVASAASSDDDEDDEAGMLLADDLAETALGVSRKPSFAEGIRLDGYAPKGRAEAAMGAVAPTAEPEVRAGLCEPAAFADVTAAIHRILDELPVPEDAKPALRRSAVKPLTLEELASDQSAEDALDEIVAQSPVIADETDAVAQVPIAQASNARTDQTEGSAPEAAAAVSAPEAPAAAPARPRRKTNLLTRRYRITHFWPRSWVRAVRRAKVKRAARMEATLVAA